MKKLFQTSCQVLGLLILMQSVASADQTILLGMDANGTQGLLPYRICAQPGEVLRFRADVMNAQKAALGIPRNQFVWQLTRADGTWWRFDARISNSFGPFKKGAVAESVEITLPTHLPQYAWIDVVYPGAWSARFSVENTVWSGSQCTYAPKEFYASQESHPAFDQGYPCQDACLKGVKCSDACPKGASCENGPENENGVPVFWSVKSCHS